MYSNESKGQKFPTNQKWMKSNPDVLGPCQTPADSFRAFFDGQAVYPEYLSDVNVMRCPSDANGEQEIQDFYTNGSPNPCKFGDSSYLYLAWAIMPRTLMTDIALENDQAITADNVFYYLTSDAQLAFADLIAGVNTWASGGTDPSVYDNDLSHGGVTAYRLREGIERFFITDINNPAASALAQSEIFVMSDDISGDFSGNFNHVPGGGNVLYMDGHVEFIKYPGETPFSRFWATFISYALGQI
jgi:prepilin-type processing-associated H-X9-DG protein